MDFFLPLVQTADVTESTLARSLLHMHLFLCLSKERQAAVASGLHSENGEREALRVVLRRSQAQESLETFTENSPSAASRLARPDTPGSCYSGRKQDHRAKLKRVAEDKAPAGQ